MLLRFAFPIENALTIIIIRIYLYYLFNNDHFVISFLLFRIDCLIFDISLFPGYSPSFNTILATTLSHGFFYIIL